MTALEAEALFVAAATTRVLPAVDRALAGAVASHFLAVGTPRSIGLIGLGAEASLEAHRTWFAPRDVRCADRATGGREVSLAEALACDIVCAHVPLAIGAGQLRGGTHVNLLAGGTIDPEIICAVTRVADLPALAAGFVDGRQLDELTIFVC